MVVCRLPLPEDHPYQALVEHLADASHERELLIVEARTAAPRLKEQILAAGGESEECHVIDATGTQELQSPDDRVHYVAGPHLLELIALRTHQIAVHHADRKLLTVIDDLDSFAKVVPDGALNEIIQRMSMRVEDPNCLEFAYTHHVRDSVENMLNAQVDHELDLEHLVPGMTIEQVYESWQ